MSSIKVSNPNNVKIYTVSGQSKSRSLPDWLERKNRKQLRFDSDWSKRIELIQDFEFNEASNRIRTTKDGKHAMATGVYKPMVKVFDFTEMTLKFERHTDTENVNFVFLSDDWTKSVHLQNDRTLHVHAQTGTHYKARVPKYGRDLAYHYPSCDVIVAGASSEIYRLNLEQGRFLNPLATSADPTKGFNCLDINPAHQLFGFGSLEGIMEFWDPRCRARVAQLAPVLPQRYGVGIEDSIEITQLKFNDDGLRLATGLSTGHVLLYDLRNPTPYIIKDHQYGLPIKSLQWIPDVFGDSTNTKIASTDAKVIKLWNAQNGSHFTSIEPTNDINECWNMPGTGLLMCANEGIQMQTYYIPSLGPAPKWCSFLDNLTEELEETTDLTVYDDYKFVSREELTSLGLSHLIGSKVLRAYMHGFLMNLELYEKARLIANPFAYEEYRKQKLEAKIEKSQSSRVQVKEAPKISETDLPPVNAALAQKLIGKSATQKSKGALLKDPRFQKLFEDPEFQVDNATEEYKMLNPKDRFNFAPKKDDLESNAPESKDPAPKTNSDDNASTGSSDGDSSDDDDLVGYKKQKIAANQAAKIGRGRPSHGPRGALSRGNRRGDSRGRGRGRGRG